MQQITNQKKEYQKSDKGKLAKTKANAKYQKSDKGKLMHIKHMKTEKGIASAARRNANRYSNEKRTEITLTAKEFNYIIFLQNYQCIGPDCESGRFFDMVKPTKDHINPVIKGGDFIKNNVQLLCQSCNSKKGIKYIDYRSDMHKKIIETI